MRSATYLSLARQMSREAREYFQYYLLTDNSSADEMFPGNLQRFISPERLVQGNTEHEPGEEAAGVVRAVQPGTGEQYLHEKMENDLKCSRL